MKGTKSWVFYRIEVWRLVKLAPKPDQSSKFYLFKVNSVLLSPIFPPYDLFWLYKLCTAQKIYLLNMRTCIKQPGKSVHSISYVVCQLSGVNILHLTLYICWPHRLCKQMNLLDKENLTIPLLKKSFVYHHVCPCFVFIFSCCILTSGL